MLGFGKFGAGLDSFIIEYSLMHKFGSAGLHCEIILCECYFRFARVAILRHKIASVSGEHHIIYLTLST